MSADTRRAYRWLVPALAAAAVLLVVAVAVAVQRSGDDPGGVPDGGPAAGGAGAVPPTAGAVPGYPGTGGGEPGAPGSGTAPGGSGTEQPPADGGTRTPEPADPGMIAVSSYYQYDARHLALNYYNGIPECYGDAGVPRVEERADAVVVSIPRTPPTGDKDTACIDIAVAGSVDVTLDRPLGDRAVLDAATGGTPVKESSAPHSERADS